MGAGNVNDELVIPVNPLESERNGSTGDGVFGAESRQTAKSSLPETQLSVAVHQCPMPGSDLSDDVGVAVITVLPFRSTTVITG